MIFCKSILIKAFIVLLLLLPPAIMSAQDTAAAKAPKGIIFTEKDILTDNDTIERLTFSKSFKSGYTTSEFDYEIKPREKNIWDRFTEWLSGLLDRIFSFTNPEASVSFIQLLFKIIAIAIIMLVIYLIVKSILNKDGQWIFGKNSDRKMIRYDEIEKNLHLVDFDKLIKETLQLGEKRLSIRYYYLWLLKKMSEGQIIEWDPEKTNSDYLHEISDERLKHNFGYLSYLYNYIWYGEFEIGEAAFEKARITFEETIHSL